MNEILSDFVVLDRFFIEMAIAIYFYRQSYLWTIKINNEFIYPILSAKFKTKELASPQFRP